MISNERARLVDAGRSDHLVVSVTEAVSSTPPRSVSADRWWWRRYHGEWYQCDNGT